MPRPDPAPRREIDAVLGDLRRGRGGASPYSPYFLLVLPPILTIALGARHGFDAWLVGSEALAFTLLCVGLLIRSVWLPAPTPEQIERAVDGVPELPLGRQWASFLLVIAAVVAMAVGPVVPWLL